MLLSTAGPEPCFTCLVFHITHTNLVHYKQSRFSRCSAVLSELDCTALSCSPRPRSLQELCRTIPGDAPLFTLFRVDGQSIRCPLQGPAQFSYDWGRGSCGSPASWLHTCTQQTRLSLQYQACPTVPGSEMRQTQFECLARFSVLCCCSMHCTVFPVGGREDTTTWWAGWSTRTPPRSRTAPVPRCTAVCRTRTGTGASCGRGTRAAAPSSPCPGTPPAAVRTLLLYHTTVLWPRPSVGAGGEHPGPHPRQSGQRLQVGRTGGCGPASCCPGSRAGW